MKLEELFEKESLPTVDTPSEQELVKKHKVSKKEIKKAVKKGTKVEKEHTKKKHVANEIARDHVGEHPDYYDKLEKVEKH